MSTFHLRVVTPDRTVVDRKVRHVRFMGVDGSYGILARHAPLMTATRPGLVEITNEDGSREDMLVTDGFAQVNDNVLTLVCEAGEMADEIDVERARAAEARAREMLADAEKVESELPRANAALQRALLRQMIGSRKASGTGTLR